MSIPVDYSKTLGGCQEYLERKGIVATYRNPEARVQLGLTRPPILCLEPPLPLPGLTRRMQNGCPPPDHGQTLQWPFPFADECHEIETPPSE